MSVNDVSIFAFLSLIILFLCLNWHSSVDEFLSLEPFIFVSCSCRSCVDILFFLSFFLFLNWFVDLEPTHCNAEHHLNNMCTFRIELSWVFLFAIATFDGGDDVDIGVGHFYNSFIRFSIYVMNTLRTEINSFFFRKKKKIDVKLMFRMRVDISFQSWMLMNASVFMFRLDFSSFCFTNKRKLLLL